MVNNYERIVPDTSVIIEGVLSRRLKSKEIKVTRIAVHEATLAELENQANNNKTKGYLGLDEIKKLQEMKAKHGFEMEFVGNRPNTMQIRNAYSGEIDAMIRQAAYDEDALFMTADKVQYEVALAKGLKAEYVQQLNEVPKLMLEKYFDKDTMSVHLREATEPTAKVGRPGAWEFKKLSSKILDRNEVKDIYNDIIEQASHLKDAFIEIERKGSTIVQLGKYRIVITRPPFSDGWEITAVRPVAKLTLEDYKLSEKLFKRLSDVAEGILIAGSPGMGKSTFAQALAEHYSKKGKIVKTIEAPRDLVLPDNVTQYAISHGTPEEVHDVLLLSRPDYTLFDEMRNTKDFALFADLRLSGIGLAGVIHATNPIDAIQRFVGRVELGMIPQIIDTVVFIKNGTAGKVLSLEMTVKVPAGMTEEDLARPIVVASDFETGAPEYELYSYGEETVVVPLSKIKNNKQPGHLKLAATSVKDYFKVYSPMIEVEMTEAGRATIYAPEKAISGIIGKQGSNIQRIEKELGIRIDVKELSGKPSASSENSDFEGETDYEMSSSKTHVVLHFPKSYKNKQLDLHIEDDYVMSGQVSKDGSLKITKKHKMGKLIETAAKQGTLRVRTP